MLIGSNNGVKWSEKSAGKTRGVHTMFNLESDWISVRNWSNSLPFWLFLLGLDCLACDDLLPPVFECNLKWLCNWLNSLKCAKLRLKLSIPGPENTPFSEMTSLILDNASSLVSDTLELNGGESHTIVSIFNWREVCRGNSIYGIIVVQWGLARCFCVIKTWSFIVICN